MRLIPLLVTAVLLANSLQLRADDDESQDDRQSSVSTTNWALLRFSNDRKIRKATIIMEPNKGFFGKIGFQPNEETIEITKPEPLADIETILSGPPLCVATPRDGQSGGGWGTACFGRIVIETTDGQFFIGISFVGFHLDTTATNINNVFWAGGLTRWLDETYSNKYQKHITFKGRPLAEQHANFAMQQGGFSEELTFRREKDLAK